MREEGGPYGLEIDGPADEEALLQAIRERGFELIPFEDHVAFRFAYESKFRSHWDRGKCTDLVVVLRAERHDLSTLPYDLLQAGRQLSFNLGELFPNLSYPVIASLVVLRKRGPRAFEEIPPSEVAEMMQSLIRTHAGVGEEVLYRQVLDFYDLKRLTSNVRNVLSEILVEIRRELSKGRRGI